MGFDLDYITIALVILILIYMVVTRGKMYKEYKAGLETAIERKDMQKLFVGQKYYIIYGIIIFASLIGIIVVWMNRLKYDDYISWMLVFAIIAVTLATDFVRIKVMFTTYFNDHGFFVESEYVRYNSIKALKQKKLGVLTTLITFNNKTYQVPAKTLKLLDAKIKAKLKK